MTTKEMTGGEAAVAALAAHHVEVIFGIPGGHSLGIYDALARQKQIRHVLGRHEQGLAFMADGYARASGKIGVLTTTSGPAVANMACAMGGATTDTSPVLAISSTVRSNLVGKCRGGLHDCGEAIDLMRPVCRYVRRCNSVAEIPAVIGELIHLLRTRRPGGAYCEIPCDLLDARAQVEISEPAVVSRLAPDAKGTSQVVQLLVSAQRPVIWAGTGVTVSDAGPELKALAERMGAIVVITALGRGIIPADHPNVITADGALHTEVNDIVARADVVLAVGTMFKQEDTAAWTTKFGEKLIHIDIDPEEIGRSYPPFLGIVADAKSALEAILQSLPNRQPAPPDWINRGKGAQAARLARRRNQSPVDMRLLDMIRSVVPRDGIVVADRCNLGYWAWRCMPAYAPRTFQYPMGYGGLGGALPQAIGAKIACPEKKVVCLIGDGGFQFTATELAVAVQEKVPITIVLCNNNIYGAIRANQDRHFGGRRFGSSLKNPDFQKLAAAYTIPSSRVDNPDDFERALQRSVQSESLNLIELAMDIMDP